MTYGLHITIDAVDVTCHAFAPIDVTWGREHPGDSFEPRRAVCGFDAIANPQRGQRLRVSLDAPDSNPLWRDAHGTWAQQTTTWLATRRSVILFDGKITDTRTTWQPIIPHTTWATVVDVTAVDPVADLSRLVVGDAPWPQETVTLRSQRIEALTPLLWVSDTSGAQVAARDVDAQPALDLLDTLASMASLAGGVYYDPNTSRAAFLLDASRGSRYPTLVLDSCDVLADVDEIESVSDIVNDCTVTYVNPADLNAQPSVRIKQDASIAANGVRNRTVSTDLVNVADATARAQSEVTRFGTAATRWEQIVLDSRVTTSRPLAEQVLAAGPGMRTRLDHMPTPAHSPWDGYTEGWAFTGDVDRWTVQLNLSPASWSGPLLSWAEAVPADLMPVNANPSFEANPWNAGWEFFWRTPSSVWSEGIKDDTAADGATYSRTHNPPAPAGQQVFQRYQMRSSTDVAPGQVWHCHCRARTTDLNATLQLFGIFAPPGIDPQYFVSGTDARYGADVLLTVDGLWHLYDVTVTVPAGRWTRGRFDLSVANFGPYQMSIDVDDVRFTLASTDGKWSDVAPTWRWMDAVDTIRWR